MKVYHQFQTCKIPAGNWMEFSSELESISSTLYARVFRTNFLPKPKRNQKKLPKQRLYEKCVRKMLMKLTPVEGVDDCWIGVTFPVSFVHLFYKKKKSGIHKNMKN